MLAKSHWHFRYEPFRVKACLNQRQATNYMLVQFKKNIQMEKLLINGQIVYGRPRFCAVCRIQYFHLGA